MYCCYKPMVLETDENNIYRYYCQYCGKIKYPTMSNNLSDNNIKNNNEIITHCCNRDMEIIEDNDEYTIYVCNVCGSVKTFHATD